MLAIKIICATVSFSWITYAAKNAATGISKAYIGSITEIFPTLNASKSSSPANKITKLAANNNIPCAFSEWTMSLYTKGNKMIDANAVI